MSSILCQHCSAPATLTCVHCVGYPQYCDACSDKHHKDHRSLRGVGMDPVTLDRKIAEDLYECSTSEHLTQYVPPPLPDSDKWSPGKELKVFVATWNMEMRAASQDDVIQLIPKNSFHILCVGTQECGGYVKGGGKQTQWETQLMGHLGRTNYIRLKSHSMMAIHCVVFVHCQVAPFVLEVESAQESTGFMRGAVGNKGGVGISIVLGIRHNAPSNTRLLFINSHLSPHQNQVAKRNSDVSVISTKLKLGTKGKNPDAFIRTAADKARNVTQEFDVCFWCGDLNYRINGSGEAIKKIVNHHMDWTAVLQNNDQLAIERRKGKVFQNFEEGVKSFQPTYKYHRDPKTKLMTEEYDKSAKQRIPSWTDRVLVVCNSPDKCGVTQHGYHCVQAIHASDHKPVVSYYTIKTQPADDIILQEVQDNKSAACLIM